MTNLNFAPGTIFHMDNLEAMRGDSKPERGE